MLCINMQKIPIKMSIINFHLNFQKYTLYLHLYKCIFNVYKKCEFYYALNSVIIALGFSIFMWLFYAYIYIFLKKICIFPVHIFLLVKASLTDSFPIIGQSFQLILSGRCPGSWAASLLLSFD